MSATSKSQASGMSEQAVVASGDTESDADPHDQETDQFRDAGPQHGQQSQCNHGEYCRKHIVDDEVPTLHTMQERVVDNQSGTRPALRLARINRLEFRFEAHVVTPFATWHRRSAEHPRWRTARALLPRDECRHRSQLPRTPNVA